VNERGNLSQDEKYTGEGTYLELLVISMPSVEVD
jgi:hypothetical protein